jgi:hydrogenase maturation factor HypF (carbamoyltransferase family)
MKVLTDYRQLVGKTIAFAHMAQFADQITLATTDGEVLMVTFDGDEYESEISVYGEWKVLATIKSHTYLQEELDKLGIFNLDEYKKEQERKRQEEMKKFRKEQEEKELRLLAELKAKYENDEPDLPFE